MNHKKIGILGGGQLGKMLCLSAANWDLKTYILDKSKDFPAGAVSYHFTEGDFKNYEDVYRFGQKMDIITIEIEHVNTEALHQLVKEGKTVHPHPTALDTIKDKGLQKQFYADKNIPTSDFILVNDEQEIIAKIAAGEIQYPFVQKTRTAGYDGQGVAVIKDEQDLKNRLLKGASVIEDLVDIEKEISVIAARNEAGDIQCYPTVEMEFNPVANLVELLFSPADIPSSLEQKAENLAREIIAAYDICGLLAVELFWTKSGDLLVNEVAPRTHNSGHHTIDSCYTSQFEQQLRAICNMPLGSTKMKTPSVMVNLLGAENHTGPVHYEGFNKIIDIEGVKPHLYGKAITKPYRKMGHITVLDKSLAEAKIKANKVKEMIRCISN